MRICPCGGDSAEAVAFQDSIANRFKAGAHDDKACGDDTNIHFDYSDC